MNRFICEKCQAGEHGECRGKTWCDCQCKISEANAWQLVTVWGLIVVCGVLATRSFVDGDLGWGSTFGFFTVFFGMVLLGAHAQRRRNRQDA